MKSFTVLCLVSLVGMACARAAGGGHTYTDRYDSIDLDQILNNRRLLVPYLKCVLDQGRCSPEGKELKAHIKEALEENCSKCTEQQQRGSRRVIGHLINHEPAYWKQLTTKFDPNNKFTRKYEDELRTVKA